MNILPLDSASAMAKRQIMLAVATLGPVYAGVDDHVHQQAGELLTSISRGTRGLDALSELDQAIYNFDGGAAGLACSLASTAETLVHAWWEYEDALEADDSGRMVNAYDAAMDVTARGRTMADQ